MPETTTGKTPRRGGKSSRKEEAVRPDITAGPIEDRQQLGEALEDTGQAMQAGETGGREPTSASGPSIESPEVLEPKVGGAATASKPSEGSEAKDVEHTDVEQEAQRLKQRLNEQAEQTLGAQKNAVAREIVGVARALRQTAQQLEAQGQGSVASYAKQAADATERMGQSIERRGMSEIVREIESYGRNQPMLMLGASALFGFVATRLLRTASAPEQVSGAEGGLEVEPNGASSLGASKPEGGL